MSKIKEGLVNLFEKHRIIVWYDEENNFNQEFESLELDGVEKLIVKNNEFALKYDMLIKQPSAKFLLYLPYARPNDHENWLLDIEMSHYIFHTDREALILQELDMPIQYRGWIKQHVDFFKSKERVHRFNQLKQKEDVEQALTNKLIQVVLNAPTDSLDDCLKSYSQQFDLGKSEQIDTDLEKFGLNKEFWESVEAIYNYRSSKSGIYDFLLELFQKNFQPLASKVQVNHSAEVLLSNWKDARSFEDTFKNISNKIAVDLNINDSISRLPLNTLLDEDVFEFVDQQIIKELANLIETESQNIDSIEQILKVRESKFWYEKYQPFYLSLDYAAKLIDEVKNNQKIQISDYQDGFKQYTTKWYLIDQYYRLFIQYYREANQNSVLSSLYNKIHKVYSNSWLLNLSNNWQNVIDKNLEWYVGSQSQMHFFKQDVKTKYLDSGNRLFVIISDAFRFECGKALHEKLNEEARFSSELSYRVTSLPSYTQLGMASLLPHSELSFGVGDDVLIDGKSTKGLIPRQKVLSENSGVRTTAILAENLMKLPARGQEAQSLIQDHDLIYVFHNRIDKLGDDKTTEEKVIEAAKEEIDFLMEVVRKVTNMNGMNLIITSDHGFIYQHEELLESDFTDAQVEGNIYKENRRFVLGQHLNHNQNVVKFAAKSLKIQSDIDVLIPKGISRLRLQGSGSRFVHGGSTLQETIVPVLFVTKKRADTVSKVNIDVLNKASNRITTNIHSVKFYQEQPVGDKFIARAIKSYFAVIESGQEKVNVISDFFTYTFDSEATRAQDREVPNKFTISTIVQRSSNVYLIIEEKVSGSDKWITISKFPYTLTIAMPNDFDSF